MKSEEAQIILEKARRAGARRDYKAAVRQLEELLVHQEVRPEALLLLGRACHALGDYGRALAAFRDHLELKPHSGLGLFFAGRSYLALGMAQRAYKLLKEAQELRPDDGYLLALLGVASLKCRRAAEAQSWLEAAVAKEPEDPRIYRAYLNALTYRGLKAIRGEDEELGIQILRWLSDNGLNQPLPHLELGRCLRRHGDFVGALEEYNRAIALAPDEIDFRWQRAALLMALGRDDAAQAELRILRELGSTVPELAWNADLINRFLIKTLMDSGDWRSAAYICRELLHSGKVGDAGTHALLAECQRNLKNFEPAINHARLAIAADPDSLELRYNLILALYEAKKWPELSKEILIAERRQADPAIMLYFKALLANQRSGDDQAVIALLQNAIRESGPIPELMTALGERYIHLDLAELAEGWFTRSLSLAPDNERAALGAIAAAESLVKDGDKLAKDRLSAAYDNYLASWPDNLSIRRERALFLVNNDDFKTAAAELEQLLAWDSCNTSLRRVLAYAYRKIGRYQAAAALLRKLLKDTPRNIRLILEFAHCLERAGAADYAASVLTKALAFIDQRAELALALGLLETRRGQTEAALDAFREAAASAPNDPRPLRQMAALYRRSGVAEMADRYEAAASDCSQDPPLTQNQGYIDKQRKMADSR